MLNEITDIILVVLGLLLIFEWLYILNVDHKHTDRIDKAREDVHDLQDYKWSIGDRVHDTRRDLKSLASSVEKLANELNELEDALHMQGIATEVKTEEVKVLVKPEDTDGEDSDN